LSKNSLFCRLSGLSLPNPRLSAFYPITIPRRYSCGTAALGCVQLLAILRASMLGLAFPDHRITRSPDLVASPYPVVGSGSSNFPDDPMTDVPILWPSAYVPSARPPPP
jgi:hypothetical protein